MEEVDYDGEEVDGRGVKGKSEKVKDFLVLERV